MKKLQLTKPLYSDSASGSITNVGTIVRKNGKFFLRKLASGNRQVSILTEQINRCFKRAKAIHAIIEKTYVYAGGKYRWLIIPSWPDFWRDFLLKNPGYVCSEANFKETANSNALLFNGLAGQFGYFSINPFGASSLVFRQ
jgi:hypothetical protein